jgi:hypothetical protein
VKSISLHLLALSGALAAALPLYPAAASAAPASPVAGVCRTVMGLESGEAQFEGCMESLGGTLGHIGGERAVVDSRRACLDRGLALGTASLAICAVQGQNAPSARTPTLVDATTAPTAAKSWFYASNRERRQRERLACASLGLDPTGSAFDSCVAGLAGALFAADNPQN